MKCLVLCKQTTKESNIALANLGKLGDLLAQRIQARVRKVEMPPGPEKAEPLTQKCKGYFLLPILSVDSFSYLTGIVDVDRFWALHLATSAMLTKFQEKALIFLLGSSTSLQGQDHVAGGGSRGVSRREIFLKEVQVLDQQSKYAHYTLLWLVGGHWII